MCHSTTLPVRHVPAILQRWIYTWGPRPLFLFSNIFCRLAMPSMGVHAKHYQLQCVLLQNSVVASWTVLWYDRVAATARVDKRSWGINTQITGKGLDITCCIARRAMTNRTCSAARGRWLTWANDIPQLDPLWSPVSQAAISHAAVQWGWKADMTQTHVSLWHWKYWSVRQTKPAPLAFGRTLI